MGKNSFTSLAKGLLSSNKNKEQKTKNSQNSQSHSFISNDSKTDQTVPEEENLDEKKGWSSIEGLEFEGVPFGEDDYMSEFSIFDDEEIDFNMVYALCDFTGTVEGQASVTQGEPLFLKDDSNSYWWLVQKQYSEDAGYVPAEALESAYEKLARLNSVRNQKLTLPLDQANFNDSLTLAKKKNKGGVSFQFPLVTQVVECDPLEIYFEGDDEEDDDEMQDYEEGEEEDSDDNDMDGEEEEEHASNAILHRHQPMEDEVQIIVGLDGEDEYFSIQDETGTTFDEISELKFRISKDTFFQEVLTQALQLSNISPDFHAQYHLLVQIDNLAFPVKGDSTVRGLQDYLEVSDDNLINLLDNDLKFMIVAISELDRMAENSESSEENFVDPEESFIEQTDSPVQAASNSPRSSAVSTSSEEAQTPTTANREDNPSVPESIHSMSSFTSPSVFQSPPKSAVIRDAPPETARSSINQSLEFPEYSRKPNNLSLDQVNQPNSSSAETFIPFSVPHSQETDTPSLETFTSDLTFSSPPKRSVLDLPKFDSISSSLNSSYDSVGSKPRNINQKALNYIINEFSSFDQSLDETFQLIHAEKVLFRTQASQLLSINPQKSMFDSQILEKLPSSLPSLEFPTGSSKESLKSNSSLTTSSSSLSSFIAMSRGLNNKLEKLEQDFDNLIAEFISVF